MKIASSLPWSSVACIERLQSENIKPSVETWSRIHPLSAELRKPVSTSLSDALFMIKRWRAATKDYFAVTGSSYSEENSIMVLSDYLAKKNTRRW